MNNDQSKLAAAEMKILEEQNKFNAIFYGSQTPMVIFKGPEAVFEICNEQYKRIYQNRELLGKPLLKVIPELKDSPFPIILKNVYETGEPYISHEGLARIYNQATGELEDRYFDTTFSRISFGDDQVFRILGIPKEVTERVSSRKKIEESLRELELERELRERFVSALSHDLRTPLSIVKMCAQILKMREEEQDEVLAMADRISQSVDRADRMIRDLLDANRIKAGVGLPLTIQNCRLDEIVAYVINDLKEIYGDRFEIINNAGELHGLWDELAIHRIIENLSINAIKYGSAESKITITLNVYSNLAEIKVHNFGNPISTEEQQFLFNQYHRTKFSLRSGQIGWGIGLTLVKGLTEAHGGTVQVESEQAHGTTFSVKLPIESQ